MKLDEAFDIVVSRPVSRALAPRFFRAGFSADQVSLIALAFGLGAGVAFTLDGIWPLIGGVLLIAMVITDCADGAVARLYPPSDKPWRGRIMDGMADLGTVLAVHIGMFVVMVNQGVNIGGRQVSAIELFILVALAFVSLSWKSSVLDDVKQRLRPASVDSKLDRYRDQDKTLIENVLFKLLVFYVGNSEKLAGHGRPGGPQVFRQVSYVGPTHHLVGIALAAIAAPFVPHAFLAYLFVAVVPSNIYMWTIMHRARRQNLIEI